MNFNPRAHASVAVMNNAVGIHMRRGDLVHAAAAVGRVGHHEQPHAVPELLFEGFRDPR